MRLIDKEDMLKHRQISKSVKSATLNQFIDDAQLVDLLPLIGDELYYDIIQNKANYVDLLNETTYQYNGVTIVSCGLIKVIILFTYARYIMHGSFTDTPFGFVEKQNQDSTQVNRTNKKEIYKQNQQIAMQYWYQVEKYLDRNTELFPKWKKGCATKKRTFRFSKITK